MITNIFIIARQAYINQAMGKGDFLFPFRGMINKVRYIKLQRRNKRKLRNYDLKNRK